MGDSSIRGLSAVPSEPAVRCRGMGNIWRRVDYGKDCSALRQTSENSLAHVVRMDVSTGMEKGPRFGCRNAKQQTAISPSLRSERRSYSFVFRPNHHHKFALQRTLLRNGQKLRRFSAQKFLKLFGQLARQDNLPLGKNVAQFGQQFFHAIR